VFLPKPPNDPKVIQPGSNTITFSAEYNFGTDAYVKAYFIDRDRFRAYAREDVDIFKEFGIKDKRPSSVSTNGPVEVGMKVGSEDSSLVTVSQGYAIKPAIGITLTNRQEIQDKDKRIIQRWEGKIKNITELILLVPPGIRLANEDALESETGCKSKKAEEKIKCPCSMPFVPYKLKDCENSCDKQIRDPCYKVCSDAFPGEKYGDVSEESYQSLPSSLRSCFDECGISISKCKEECNFLFKPDSNDEKGTYTGYALDVSSLEFRDLNKDIDKHRSFLCRFDPSQEVLDTNPITTRYFRVRARYNYLLENHVTVNVDETPLEAIQSSPDSVCKIASDFRPPGDIWQGQKVYGANLISAIAWVESKWRHCCKDAGRTSASSCIESGEKSCPENKILKSYDGSSIGIMQIQYYIPKDPTRQIKLRNELDTLARQHCGTDGTGRQLTVFDYDCNVKIGIARLEEKLRNYGNGCRTDCCEKLQSNKPPYKNPGGTPKRYSEYRSIEAALRGYNGFGGYDRQRGTCTDGDLGYVEKVLEVSDKMEGCKVIDNTMREVTGKGEGSKQFEDTTSEATTQQTTQPVTSQPYQTSGIEAKYNTQTDSITISWFKFGDLKTTKYRVDRFDKDGTLNVCEEVMVTEDQDNVYSCVDLYGKFVPNIKYTYKVTAVVEDNQNSNSLKTVEYTFGSEAEVATPPTQQQAVSGVSAEPIYEGPNQNVGDIGWAVKRLLDGKVVKMDGKTFQYYTGDVRSYSAIQTYHVINDAIFGQDSKSNTAKIRFIEKTRQDLVIDQIYDAVRYSIDMWYTLTNGEVNIPLPQNFGIE